MTRRMTSPFVYESQRLLLTSDTSKLWSQMPNHRKNTLLGFEWIPDSICPGLTYRETREKTFETKIFLSTFKKTFVKRGRSSKPS